MEGVDVVFTFVTVMVIILSLLHTQGDLHADILLVNELTLSNKQFIHSNELSIRLNKQDIQSVKQSTWSNKQAIRSNKQSVLSHEQLTFSLLSRGTYLHEYIEDRDMTLQGVEWIHRTVKGETIYGPTFYMRECKLRLHMLSKRNQLDVEHYVTRLEGRYDVISSCHITGFVVYIVNALDSTESSSRHRTHDVWLGVRDQ